MNNTHGSHVRNPNENMHHNANRIIAFMLSGLLAIVFILLIIIDLSLTDRMPMGTVINGVNVSRMTSNEAYDALNDKLNEKNRIIRINGNDYKPSDLNLMIKHDATIDGIVHDSNWLLKAIPGNHHYNAVFNYDVINASNMINGKIPADELKGGKLVIQPSYDATTMTINNGSKGIGINDDELSKKLNEINLNENRNVINVSINANQEPVVIKDYKNEILSLTDNRSIVFNDATDDRNIHWNSEAIGSILKIEYDGNGSYSIEPDLNLIRNKVNETLNAFGKKMNPDVIMMTPDGKTKIAQIQWGNDGTAADANADDISKGIHDYLINDGKDKKNVYNVDFTMKTVEKTTENRNAPGDFNVENGSPWLKVDLSAQKAYAYKGTTLVNTFNVATGKTGHRTDNGVYYVNVKYRTQTMRGEDYVTPNVPWISYFNGGEGFHGASWNYYNINRGIPSSHGCVNMYVNDAKWVYDFAPIGTKVEVVGSSPAKAR